MTQRKRKSFEKGYFLVAFSSFLILAFSVSLSIDCLISASVIPVIHSVSQITPSGLQTITISGSGFGDTQPVIMYLGDGLINTVGGGKNLPGQGNTPVIQIHDYAREPWQAGVQDSPLTAWCSIGVILEKWSDKQIVLGGFGSALNNGHWIIQQGDSIEIVIITPGGVATYDTTVVSYQTENQGNQSQNQDPEGYTVDLGIVLSLLLSAIILLQIVMIGYLRRISDKLHKV